MADNNINNPKDEQNSPQDSEKDKKKNGKDGEPHEISFPPAIPEKLQEEIGEKIKKRIEKSGDKHLHDTLSQDMEVYVAEILKAFSLTPTQSKILKDEALRIGKEKQYSSTDEFQKVVQGLVDMFLSNQKKAKEIIQAHGFEQISLKVFTEEEGYFIIFTASGSVYYCNIVKGVGNRLCKSNRCSFYKLDLSVSQGILVINNEKRLELYSHISAQERGRYDFQSTPVEEVYTKKGISEEKSLTVFRKIQQESHTGTTTFYRNYDIDTGKIE